MVILRKPVPGLTEMALVRFLHRAGRSVGLPGAVNVLVTTNKELRSLNRRFCGKDKPTDVLSFPPMPGLVAGLAGDIAISAEIAAAKRRRTRAFSGFGGQDSGPAWHTAPCRIRSRVGPGRYGPPGNEIAQIARTAFGVNRKSRRARRSEAASQTKTAQDARPLPTKAMNYAIAIALILLAALLTLVSYVERIYNEIGKFLSREFQDNIDVFEQTIEPKLGIGPRAGLHFCRGSGPADYCSHRHADRLSGFSRAWLGH